MTFEELHEAIEGENSVSEKEAIKLLEEYSKKDRISKKDIIDNAAAELADSIICLDNTYNKIIEDVCLLEYETVSVDEYRAFRELSDFLKGCIKQLNRYFKKLEKYNKKAKQ